MTTRVVPLRSIVSDDYTILVGDELGNVCCCVFVVVFGRLFKFSFYFVDKRVHVGERCTHQDIC
jgi:uncharacterized membrane protein